MATTVLMIVCFVLAWGCGGGVGSVQVQAELFVDSACSLPFQTSVGASFCDLLGTGKFLVACNDTGTRVELVSYTCPSAPCAGNCTLNAPTTWPAAGACLPPPPSLGLQGSGRFTCLSASASASATASAIASPSSPVATRTLTAAAADSSDCDNVLAVVLAVGLWTWLWT